MAEILAASAQEYLRRGLEIRAEGLSGEARIWADPTYFRSVLMNLLDNSAKYKGQPRHIQTVWAAGYRFKP